MLQPSMQAAGRRMSYHGLHHVLGLGVAYHSASSTGRLVRMLERGVWSSPAANYNLYAIFFQKQFPCSELTVYLCMHSCCLLQVTLLQGVQQAAEGQTLLCHFCRHQEHSGDVPRDRVPAGADVAGDRGGGVGAVAHVSP